jgi:ferric-dicitrate binding protein FerR (iron transport regulator)
MNRSELDECIESWRELTAVDEADVARAQQRLDAAERPTGYDPSELKDAPRPGRGAASRVEARLRAHSQPPPAPWGWSAGMALVMVTAALLLLSIGGPPMPEVDPWEEELAIVDAAPEVLSQVLDTSSPELNPTEHLRLLIHGEGELTGATDAPRIAWTHGALGVDVDPGQGVDLQITTAEADVAVVGTAFTVDRDARRGTRVSVRSGEVRAACRGAEPIELAEGGELFCPARAALLGDARRLARDGEHQAAVLAASRGLGMGDSGPLVGELLFVRMESRIAAGQLVEARADAETYLQTGGPRAATVRDLILEL